MAIALLAPLLRLADASDPVPADNDVVAGGTALLVFGFLILAVVVLAFSFNKQLRKTKAAREAGVFGDEPAAAPPAGATAEKTQP
ncbi:MAG: hypothetical protein ABIO16_04465 [Nocardioides sp.]